MKVIQGRVKVNTQETGGRVSGYVSVIQSTCIHINYMYIYTRV